MGGMSSELAPQVATLEEARELIQVLWLKLAEQSKQIEAQAAQIEAQAAQIKALEEKLNTNSRNSSKPPSTDQGAGKGTGKKKTRSGKKAGGQPGHVGRGRSFFPAEQVDQTHPLYPPRHCECGGKVRATRLHQRHQTMDIPPIKPQITEYQLFAGACQACGKQHEAVLPADVCGKLVGPRLLALIGALTGGYRLSKRLVQSLLKDVFHIDLSVGLISQSEARISAVLETIVQEAHTHVQQAGVVHSDETGHKEKGKKQWMWVAIAGVVSVFMARAARSADIAKELLGSAFAGILVSDRYSAYTWVDAARRQWCWAHLLRDFTKISERSGVAGQVGEQLLAHTKRMFRYWHKVRDGTLSREKFIQCMTHIQAKMEAALQRAVLQGDAQTANTCKRILKFKTALWTFVYTPGVEPTNNLAERTIRSYVIWRKTSFGTQSKRGSVYMERMMTAVGSCKLQGRNILEFLTLAIRAHGANAKTPSLIPASAG